MRGAEKGSSILDKRSGVVAAVAPAALASPRDERGD